MGRARRICGGGIVYHALNRGNGRQTLFHKEQDYDAFIKLMVEALARVPIRLLGFCLMPNHWHLVLWPRADGELSQFIGWLTNTHVKRYRRHYQDIANGHLYQGRFRSFPVQDDLHLLTALRYVEANALQAGLCDTAAGWRWSSFSHRQRGDRDGLLCEWPVVRPPDWEQLIHHRVEEGKLKKLQESLRRGRPFGDDTWARQTAKVLGLESTLRPHGRPTKSEA